MRARNRRDEREERRIRIAHRKRRERIMRCLVVAFLCAGIAVQTMLIVRLAGGYRKVDRLESEIDQLNSDATNYELAIGSNGDRSALKNRAMNVLGMVEPDAEHIRVVRVPLKTEADTQLVMNEPVNE